MARSTTLAAQPRSAGRDHCAPPAPAPSEARAQALEPAPDHGALSHRASAPHHRAHPSPFPHAAAISPALASPPSLTAPAARLLPILFWLLGSFFYFGDLGKWTDDYAFTEVDPITGRAETLWRDGEWILWRPLMLKVNSFLQTVLWEHDRALHLIGASIHAAAAFLLWRFALSLGFGRLVAAFMGLLFLTYPGYYHVIFWSTAIPIGLAAVLMLLVMHGAVRWARGQARWWTIPPLALASYVLTCMYEQPGAALGALPLLCLAVSPGGQPLHVRLWRAAAVTIPCCMGVGLYLVLYWYTMPPGSLGRPESLIGVDEMYAKAFSFGEYTGEYYLIQRFKDCAEQLGLEAMAAYPVRSGLLIGAIAGATLLWASRASAAAGLQLAHEQRGDHTSDCNIIRPFTLAAFAAAAFILALMPVYLVRPYGAPDSRMLYAPAVGLVLLMGLGAEALRALPWPTRLRPISAFIAVFACSALFLWFAIMQVGTQSALRQRWAYDVAESAQLRELIPDPPSNTVFVPMALHDMPHHTCWRLNYLFAFGIWSHSWTAMHEPARLYKRADLFASYGRWEGGPWNYAAADEHTLLMRHVLTYKWGPHPFAPEVPGNGRAGYRVPWKNIVAFTADETGTIHLVTHVRFTGPAGQETVVPLPMAGELLKAGRIERHEHRLHLVPLSDEERNGSAT